jgi:transcription-repair coupling factor (superfamily II helicase)
LNSKAAVILSLMRSRANAYRKPYISDDERFHEFANNCSFIPTVDQIRSFQVKKLLYVYIVVILHLLI